MAGSRPRFAIHNAVQRFFRHLKAKTIQAVAHFVEFLMILGTLFWAVEARAADLKKLSVPPSSPNSMADAEQFSSQNSLLQKPGKDFRTLARGPASVAPAVDGYTSHIEYGRKTIFDKPIFLTAPESISSGRYLPDAIRETPTYVAPSIELFRFGSSSKD